MFIRIIDNKLVAWNDTEFQEYTKEVAVDYDDYTNNPGKWIFNGSDLDLNPNYETEQTAKRKAEFESKFLELATNKNFRLQPKGYANAQQSIDTVNNLVNSLGSLTEQIATMVLFYETPDFSKPEECTEEWLIQHQYSAEPMTKEEWTLFYIDFTTKYAEKMYQQALLEGSI